MNPAQRLAMLTSLPTSSAFTRREVLEIHVDVVEARPELRRKEIAQVLGRRCVQVRRALMNVPRDFDIFSPFTVRKPCVCTAVGVRKPAPFSIAGQNSAWKYTMSLPMKW